MEVINYRITEGSTYGWDCFGRNAFWFDSCAAAVDDYSVGIIFDTITNIVYQMVVYDYQKNKAYRWTNPDYLVAYENEVALRKVPDTAWDDVKFTNLTSASEMLRESAAIINEYVTSD